MAGPVRRRLGSAAASRRLEIRLSETEYEAIRVAASRPGRGISLSRFVAEAAVMAAGASPLPRRARGSPTPVALAEIADAVAAINRIGNNLNQLAREKNATGDIPAQTEVVIQRVRAALDRLTTIVDDVHRDLS